MLDNGRYSCLLRERLNNSQIDCVFSALRECRSSPDREPRTNDNPSRSARPARPHNDALVYVNNHISSRYRTRVLGQHRLCGRHFRPTHTLTTSHRHMHKNPIDLVFLVDVHCWLSAMKDEHTKPEPERATEPKARPCLLCRLPFQSNWAGERICRRCKSTPAWRSAVGLDQKS